MDNDVVAVSGLPGTYRVLAVHGELYSLLPADGEAERFLRETLDPALQARRGLRVDTQALNVRPVNDAHVQHLDEAEATT